ncbi:MAG: putative inorganic carbon transporter subunit DabA, partial [Pseudomonadota bacterium]
QRAAEIAYQEELAGKLAASCAEAAAAPLKLQAVFCIDVRSELMRRHLEAQDPGVRTKGFAGFFGLPLEYRAAGTDFSRPQLPGLLAPAIEVTEEAELPLPGKVNQRTRWTELGDKPPAMFGLVEASGPLYAMKLFKDSFFPAPRRHPVNTLRTAQPLTLKKDGVPLEVEERAELAATALHAMGLERDFAPVVMLVGHGSTSRNNPHAASLDCGACGGQTGELNSRALAELLNDAKVRKVLGERGVQIPEGTRFIAALHDTSTDEISPLGCGVTFPEDVSEWLQAASAATRAERAEKLGVQEEKDTEAALEQRSRDWSQVRPEWGLANNAAFVAAPREHTRGLNLDGRVFLHDYDWREDHDGGVLELIMTAPMVVANWINTQYNASVADNVRYGSGNKVLHNVVNGNLGVFEGNGGDLRIGLPMQSLHDGERWMHTPLRLSVCLAAPQAAIQDVYERQAVVRDLVDNDWLFLFRLDDNGGLQRLYRDSWKPFSGEAVEGQV